MEKEIFPDEFLSVIAGFCREHEMFRNETVLAALSGGGDSVALLDVLLRMRTEFGITVKAAHLNHAARGKASDEDETFCRELCKKWGVPLVVAHLDFGNLSIPGESFETAARNRRMAFLETAARDVDAARIATGHTRSDQVETVFQRLLRGTGPSGIAGILPNRDGKWVRPLLCVDRAYVRKYLRNRNIPYREDETNSDTSFLRNRIRHKLLPFIRAEFAPGIDTIISRMADLARIQELWIGEEVEKAFRKCAAHADEFKILLEKPVFTSYHRAIRQRVIRYCLDALEGAGRDEDRDEVDRIMAASDRKREVMDVTAALKFELYDNCIIFSKSLDRFGPIPLAVPGETSLPQEGGKVYAGAIELSNESGILASALIPKAVVNRYGDLSAGSVRNGETMETVRDRKPARIRDCFTAAGIPRTLREYIPVIRAGAVPIWIPGIALSRLAADVSESAGYADGIHLAYRGGIDWRMSNNPLEEKSTHHEQKSNHEK